MAEFNDKPSLASFAQAINTDIEKNPNAQKVAQKATQDLSPTGSFGTYKFNREDAIRYDDPELGYLPFRNNENLYGEYQTTAEKWGNGLTKFVGKTGTNVIGNLAGTVYGAVAALATWDIDSFFDNDFFAALDKADTYMDNELANYYTDEEKNASLLSRAFSANTWADKVLGGASFVAGAVISETVASLATAATFGGAGVAQAGLTARLLQKGRQLFKAADKINDALKVEGIATRGAIRGIDDAISVAENAAKRAPKIGEYVDDASRLTSSVLADKAKTIGMSNAINRIGQFGRQQLHGTLFEAGVEAMHHGKELKEEMIRKYEQQYGQTVDAEQLAIIDELVDNSQLSTFAVNAALLTATNMAQFKEFSYGIRDLMAIGKKSGAKIATKEIVEETTEEGLKKFVPGFEKWSKFRKIADKTWNYTKNPIMEGIVEEGLQGVINNTFHEYNLHKYNPNGLATAMDLSTAFGEALGKQYGTVDGWEENMIGMILGGVGVPMARRTTKEDGTKGWKFEMSGGIATDIRESKAKKEDIQNRANFLQKTYDAFVTQDENGKKKFDQAKFMSSVVTNAVEMASIAQQRDQYVQEGDFKRAKDADADMAFSFFKARYDTGRFQDTVTSTVEGIEQMSNDDFKKAFNYDPNISDSELAKRKDETIKSFVKQSEQIKTSLKETDQLIPNADENLRAGVAHAIFRNRNAEDRIKRISEEISYMTNNAVTPETLSRSLNNQFTLNNFLNPDVNFVESPDFKNNYITNPDITPEQKNQIKKEYDRGIELVSKIIELEEAYNKPAPSGLTEEGLNKFLENKTKTENDLIAAKEEYLAIGQKYLPSFKTIKDVNDVRLNTLIGDTKAMLALNTDVDTYVKEGNTNSVMVADLQRDLNKLLADKVTFARLYNYLLTNKGKEEFESIDKSIKNSLTEDYLKLISTYNLLNTKLMGAESKLSFDQLLEIEKRVADRVKQERENTPPELFNELEVTERIRKEEEKSFKYHLLSDAYNEQAFDKAEEEKKISYSDRLLNMGNVTNLSSFLQKTTAKKDDKKDDPKTPEELNAEITKENKELEDLATESGIDLKPLQSLNRVYKNTKNALDKYNNEEKPTPEAKAKLKDLVGILKDELEQVEELYEDLVADEKKPLDAKVDKKFKEIISKSKALVTQADKTLKTKTSKTEDDVVDDEGVVVEFPNYFQNLYRGSIDSPIEGLDYTVNRDQLKDAWINNKVVVRKRKLEKPVNVVTSNKFIVRSQEYSYDVVIKNDDGTETFVGVLSTPNSFKFKKSNGDLIDVDYNNTTHIKAFNSEFVTDTNDKNEDGEIFSAQARAIQEWEDEFLDPLEEDGEVDASTLKKVFKDFSRFTIYKFEKGETKPTFKETEFFKDFDQHSILFSEINVKPRYQEGGDYTTLKNVRGMYYFDNNIIIFVTKDEQGNLVEYNFENSDIIKNKITGVEQLVESDVNLPWINLAKSVDELMNNGISRFMITKPFGGDMVAVALSYPAFSKELDILGAFKQLEQQEVTTFEFNTDDQNRDVITPIDLGEGFKGLIFPDKKDRAGRPYGITLNLTETNKEFSSTPLVEDGTIESDKPVGAFIPLIPKGKDTSKKKRIAIGVDASLRKEYNSKDKKFFYQLQLKFKQNIAGKELITTVDINIEITDKGPIFKFKGSKPLPVTSLQDLLKALHTNTGLLKGLSSDPVYQDLIKNFNVGFNPKLNETVLRKKATDVGENFSALNAGGKVYLAVHDELIKKYNKPAKAKDNKSNKSKAEQNNDKRRTNRKDTGKQERVTVNNTFDKFFENGVNELAELYLNSLLKYKKTFIKDSKSNSSETDILDTVRLDVDSFFLDKILNTENEIIETFYNASIKKEGSSELILQKKIIGLIVQFTDIIDRVGELDLPADVIELIQLDMRKMVGDKALKDKIRKTAFESAVKNGVVFEEKGKKGKKETRTNVNVGGLEVSIDEDSGEVPTELDDILDSLGGNEAKLSNDIKEKGDNKQGVSTTTPPPAAPSKKPGAEQRKKALLKQADLSNIPPFMKTDVVKTTEAISEDIRLQALELAYQGLTADEIGSQLKLTTKQVRSIRAYYGVPAVADRTDYQNWKNRIDQESNQSGIITRTGFVISGELTIEIGDNKIVYLEDGRVILEYGKLRIEEKNAAKARLAFASEIKKLRDGRIDSAIPSDELERINEMKEFEKTTKHLFNDAIFAMNDEALKSLQTNGIVISRCPF